MNNVLKFPTPKREIPDVQSADFEQAMAERFENGVYAAQEDAAILRQIANSIILSVRTSAKLFKRLDVANSVPDARGAMRPAAFDPKMMSTLMVEAYDHILIGPAYGLLAQMVEDAFVDIKTA